jgi:hypothetical protein
MRAIDHSRGDDGSQYVTFGHAVDTAFQPTLDDEHSGFVWAPIDHPPQPLHPGVKATLDKMRKALAGDAENASGKLSETTREKIGEPGSEKREDMPESVFLGPGRTYPVKEKRDGEWKYSRNLLLAAARRARMQGRNDLARRADAIRNREFGEGEEGKDRHGAADHRFVEDRSARMIDDAGRMHVADCVISKAIVSPYYGAEINEVMQDEPGWQMLDPEKKYHLLRDPEALEKSVDTWNGLPLLWVHRAATADDHPTQIVVGATGTNARFEYPNLINDIAVWPKYATEAVQDGEKQSLSCGYGYRAEMTPGTFEGKNFDGRMVAIKGNHVALVTEPRVPGAKVADSMPWPDRDWHLLERAIRSLAQAA